MPPLDVTRPEIIKFLKETYDKTAGLRLRWNILHKEKLQLAAQFTGAEKGYYQEDVARSVLEAGMVATRRENINTAAYRRTLPAPPHIVGLEAYKRDHTIIKMGLGDPKEDPRLERADNDYSPDPIMRPIPPEQKNMIYEGIPDFGRLEYLKVRNRIKPEDKYYFQESMGWQCGWRMKDSYFGKTAPLYPRQGLLKKTLNNRTGFQPDPTHYKSPTV